MDRYAALIILLSGTALAKPPKPPSAKKSPSLHVRSIDLARRYVLIELTGVSKSPEPNLYTFTDDRDRHFVALNASCDPAFPSGARACELQIPDGYQRHRLIQLELHLGGLHGRTIAAPVGEIAAAWAAAQAMLVGAGPVAVAFAQTIAPAVAFAQTVAQARQEMKLTALDWIAVIVAGIGVVWSGVLIPLVFVPHFAKMYADFGGVLSAPTLLVLKHWPPMVASMIPLILLGMGAFGGRPLPTRRGLIVGAFVAGGAVVGLSMWALYVPIFELAGKIQ